MPWCFSLFLCILGNLGIVIIELFVDSFLVQLFRLLREADVACLYLLGTVEVGLRRNRTDVMSGEYIRVVVMVGTRAALADASRSGRQQGLRIPQFIHCCFRVQFRASKTSS